MDGEPYYIMDLGNIQKQYRKWLELLPRVAPFYAVKCNSDGKILDTMVALGSSFDCASAAEIKEIITRGVAPSKIM